MVGKQIEKAIGKYNQSGVKQYICLNSQGIMDSVDSGTIPVRFFKSMTKSALKKRIRVCLTSKC